MHEDRSARSVQECYRKLRELSCPVLTRPFSKTRFTNVLSISMSPLLVQTRVLRYSLGLHPLLMFQGLVSSIKETILTDYNPGNLIGDKYEGATNVGQVQARTDVPGRILEIPVPRSTFMKQDAVSLRPSSAGKATSKGSSNWRRRYRLGYSNRVQDDSLSSNRNH